LLVRLSEARASQDEVNGLLKNNSANGASSLLILSFRVCRSVLICLGYDLGYIEGQEPRFQESCHPSDQYTSIDLPV